MSTQYSIIGSAVLHGRQLVSNGIPVYRDHSVADFDVFAKGAYREMDLNYLKFFKMDHLCKQGFLTAEAVMRNLSGIEVPASERIAIGIGGAWASLETDQRFYASYEEAPEHIPSPGVFVYTLPNILIGELCIRHRFTGEHASFILEPTQLESLYLYAGNLLETGLAEACLVGWNDAYDDLNHCVLAWVARASESSHYQPFTEDWHTVICRMNGLGEEAAGDDRLSRSKTEQRKT